LFIGQYLNLLPWIAGNTIPIYTAYKRILSTKSSNEINELVLENACWRIRPLNGHRAYNLPFVSFYRVFFTFIKNVYFLLNVATKNIYMLFHRVVSDTKVSSHLIHTFLFSNVLFYYIQLQSLLWFIAINKEYILFINYDCLTKIWYFKVFCESVQVFFFFAHDIIQEYIADWQVFTIGSFKIMNYRIDYNCSHSSSEHHYWNYFVVKYFAY